MNKISKYFEKQLKKSGHYDEVGELNAYVGDIHNHCGISYGYGTIENAILFAKNQLDFFSVTGHFAWPDMEDDKNMMIPPDVIAYHKDGFKKLRKNWPHYKKCMKESESKVLIPFLSYEYHSFEYGDYTILCKDINADLPSEVKDGDVDYRLRDLIDGNEEQQEKYLCTPHHIGYKTGFRGINWDLFNEKVSPLVEIASMHGCAESMETRLKYLHTMGPRSNENTYQGGLGKGYHFGVVGSTDHHNAAPGSYGSGRTVLYAPELTRESVWTSLRERNTSAVTGDPIQSVLYINNVRSGKVAPYNDGNLDIEAYVAAYDKLDKVELIQDGKVISGFYDFQSDDNDYSGYVSLMFGWGKKHKPCIWDIEIYAENGSLIDSSPRLRGIDMVDPLDIPEDSSLAVPCYSFEENRVKLHVMTDGNTTAQTDATNGVVVEVDGDKDTVIVCKISAKWNNKQIIKEYRYPLSLLKKAQQSDYIDGFVSPAIEVGKLNTIGECSLSISEKIKTESKGAIYLRAYEKNGDALYTSPISFK